MKRHNHPRRSVARGEEDVDLAAAAWSGGKRLGIKIMNALYCEHSIMGLLGPSSRFGCSLVLENVAFSQSMIQCWHVFSCWIYRAELVFPIAKQTSLYRTSHTAPAVQTSHEAGCYDVLVH